MLHRRRYFYRLQAVAHGEHELWNGFHRCRYVDLPQLGTLVEGLRPHGLNAVRQRDFRKRAAPHESMAPDRAGRLRQLDGL